MTHINGHLEQLRKNISVILSSITLTIGLIFGAGITWQKLTGTPYLAAEAFTSYEETHNKTHKQEKELLKVQLDYIKKALDRMEAHHMDDHGTN